MKKLDPKSIGNILTLTPLQEGMLFHYLQNPNSEFYFEQLTLGIFGTIDVDLFEKAWNHVVQANEMLRTAFRWQKLEKPSLVIFKENPCEIRFHDLSDKNEDAKTTVLLKIKTDDKDEGFDLMRVPFRITLCKLGGIRYEMIISNHHILYDGWSNGIILKEFFNAYRQLSSGTLFIPTVKPGFKQFIKYIKQQDTAKQEQFWEHYLKEFNLQAGTPGVPGAETYKRKKNMGTSNTSNIRFQFPGELKNNLDTFIKNNNITTASLLYGAWGVLLQQYHAVNDIIFDATVSGRGAGIGIKGIENMVGVFINTLPLRIQTYPGEIISAFLVRTYRMLREWTEFENSSLLPVREMLDKCRQEILFDSVVVFENYPLDSLTSDDTAPLTLHSFSIIEKTLYDLTVIITTLKSIELNITYNNELFSEAGISQLFNHFIFIIREMTGHPGKAVSEINVLTSADREKFSEHLCSVREMKTGTETGYVAPRDQVEKKLVEIWSDVLNISPDIIGIDHNFFDFGGHSLKASLAVSKIHQAIDVKIPLSEIFNHPTIRELTQYIQKTGAEKYIPFEPGEKKEYYPLSSAQKRLYMLQQLDLQCKAYNASSFMRMEGALDKNRVENCFRTLLHRHESLRTAFLFRNEEPVQQIFAQVDFHLMYLEAPGEKTNEIINNFIQPFDLTRPPLFRAGLIKTSENTHILLFDMHHIISDGSSVNILVNEFMQIYAGVTLENHVCQYKDFSQWQDNALKSGGFKKQEEFWLNQFKRELPVLDMPLDYPRPPTQSFEGDRITGTIDYRLASKIFKLVKQTGTTLYMIFAAVMSILLSKYTRQEEIIIGSPIAGRNHRDLQNIFGLFVEMIAVTFNPSNQKRFDIYLEEVKKITLESYENQDYPFGELLRTVGWEDMSRNPFFDIMLIVQNQGRKKLEIEGLKVEILEFENKTSKLDINLEVFEDGNNIQMELEYCSRLFKRDTIETLMARLERILLEVVETPNKELHAIDMMSREERRKILESFNDTKTEYEKEKSIYQLIEEQVSRTPDHIAVIGSSFFVQPVASVRHIGLSYGELNDQCNRLAYWLQEKGIQPDTIVGIKVERSIEMVTGILGILKAGGAYMPIDPEYPAERIDYMLKDSNARILITDNEKEKMNNCQLSIVNCQLSMGEQRASLQHPGPHHLAYIIYTSGSTGRPKGLMTEQRGVVNISQWFGKTFNIGIGTHLLQLTEYIFDPSVEDIFGTLFHGGTVYVAQKELVVDTGKFGRYVRKNDIHIINYTPGMLDRLLGTVEETYESLKIVISGGERLEQGVKDRLLGKGYRLYNNYGPTEVTVDALSWKCGPGRVTIGKAAANVMCYIVDKNLKLTPIGVPGELYVGGDGVARGYLNNPGLTFEKFNQDLWDSQSISKKAPLVYRTGDLARWLPDGNIEFMGRIDNQVKIRGYRVELGEIETGLSNHENIQQAVVTAREDKDGNPSLYAYFVSTKELTVSQLREYLAKFLPLYMIPAYFIRLAEIPLTSNGKPDMKRLPYPEAEMHPGGEYIEPRTETEKTLAGIWREVLGKKAISVKDNFFEVGGNSISMIQVMVRIRKEMGRDISFKIFFENMSLEELAREIELRAAEEIYHIPRAGRDMDIPLSFSQERLWFLQELDADNAAYFVPRVIRMKGKLDIYIIERTFTEIIRRHEILRTVFPTIDGQPVQQIQSPYLFKIPVLDLGWLEKEEQEQKVSEFLSEEGRRPFDFEYGPLLRVTLLKLGEAEHLFVLTEHHLIHDGWTQGVLLREFITIFSAYSEAKEHDLPGLPIQYADYAIWQRSYLQGERLKRHLDYWQEKLSGLIPALEFPVDRPRPAEMSGQGALLEFHLSSTLTGQLKKFSRENDVTLFITMLAMLKTLLYRYTGEEDLCVGTGIANRGYKDMEGMLGMVINTIPLRTHTVGDLSFTRYLNRVKETCLEAYQHQDTPFGKIVEALAPERSLSYSPIFQVLFSFMDTPGEQLRLPGFELELLPTHNRSAKFDINAIVVPPPGMNDGEILVEWEYNIDIFDVQTMERMIGHYIRLMEGVVDKPGMCIANIPMLSGAETHRLLVEWNNTAADYPGDKTIHRLFEEQVEKTPDRVAVVGAYGGEEKNGGGVETLRATSLQIQMSYRQLNDQANQWTGLLIEKGVLPDTIVGIMMERSVEMIIGIMGILKSGGAYMPIDPEYPRERIDYTLKDSNAAILLTDEKEINCQLSIVNCQLSTGELRASLHHSNHLAYVIYTSGTTGRPKGSLIDHRNVVRLLFNDKFQFDFSSRDVWTLFHSFCFDFSVWEMYGTLLYGGKLIIVPKMVARDTGGFLELLSREAVTVLNQTPSAFYILINEALSSHPFGKNLCIKYVIFGGEALNPSKLKDWQKKYPQTRLINMFGITETTVHVTYKELSEKDLELNTGNIGKPIPTLSVYILDRYLKPVPTGVTGEIYVGGAGVARGYLNRPELTSEKFKIKNGRGALRADFYHSPLTTHQSPLYRSGDLARHLANGDLEYLGRIDNQVKIRGFRIELGEIENRLAKYPGIKEAVVLVQGAMRGDKYLCAYVVCDGENVIPGLREYLALALPDYMIPSHFVRLEKIPLTPNNKIDRKELPEPGLNVGESYTAPRNVMEKQLAAIWAEVLGKDELTASQLQTSIGIDDNFFQLGGHSLKATILVSKLHKVFNVKIPLTEIFRNPTVRELSDYIGGAVGERYAQVEPSEKKEYYALSPAQKRLYFLREMDKDGTAYNIPAAWILEGIVDKDKLEQSIRELIQRHESFRTSFIIIGEKPVQKIYDEVAFEIEYKDLATDTLPQHGQTRTFLINFIRPFDLSRAPLLRVGLMEIEKGRYLFLVDMHHIISDGVSIQVLARDFSGLYSGKELPEIKLQYKDFAEWQKQESVNKKFLEQGEYWKKEYGGEIPVLELPTDYARPAVQVFEGDRVNFEITRETAGVLKSLALETGTTLYMVLLAIYNIFLAKLSSREDIVVGSPAAGRRHADLDKVIGMFVNTLALRNYPAGEKTFSEFLHEVKEKALSAFENQDYPYEDLVEKVTITRDVSRNPLFDTMFALQNIENTGIDIPGLKLIPYPYKNKISKFDLTLSGVEEADSFSFTFEYSTQLFKKETMDRFSGYFKNILGIISENKDRKISNFEIITIAEKKQILFGFNDTDSEYPKDKTVHELFAEQVEKTPDHTALVGSGPRACPVNLTYRQLNEQSDHLAGVLIGKGVQADNIVGIMIKHPVKMIIGILGILKSGGAYLPIEPDYPQQRIDYTLNDSQTKILITNKSEIRNPKLETNLNKTNSNDQNKNRNSGGTLVLNFEHLNLNFLKGSPRRGVSNSDIRASNLFSSNLAYIIYTSGSTGKPKGVMIDHRAFIDFTTWAVVEFEHGPGYRVLLSNSYTADASIQQIFPPLISGGTLHLIDKELRLNTAHYLDYLKTQRINNVDEVPVLMYELLAQIDPHDPEEKLPALTCLSLGSEYVPIDLVKKCRRHLNHHGRIINAYGPTEASVEVTTYHYDGTSEREESLIGKPRRNLRVYILDKTGHCCPIGVSGEICVSGVGLARGYLNQPELTAEKFNRSYRSYKTYILYKTGDRGGWLADGNIRFLGRIDNQIKIRGYRVELQEIENVLKSHNEIKDAVVLTEKNPAGEIVICAYYVPGTGTKLSLREYLEERLPSYMIPSYWMELEKIPLTPNGKVDRKALPKPGLKIGENYTAPTDELEKKLVKTWSDILNISYESIGIDDNFFQLGGHSLKATLLMSGIHKELEVKVELMEIFRTPTIRGLARWIRGLKKEIFKVIEPLEKKEYYPLSSAQKRLYFLQQLDLNSTGYNMPMVLPLGPEITRDGLEAALKQLIARHESLRTSFERINEDVVQRIHERAAFEIEYLAAKNAKGREDVQHSAFSIQHFIDKFIRPFDLSKAPLIRSGLIRLPEGNHLWIVDVHHIVSDGTSHTILTEDFMRLYGTSTPLAPLPLQYKDFAQWQNQLLASGRVKSQEDYWLQLYTGEIPRLNLATDYKRPAVFTFAGDECRFQLEKEDAAKFKALGARYEGTLYMNMMAALNTLFYKYTGQTDIIIGSGIAGRRHADIQGVVGMFVNTLAMRNYPAAEKTYENFLREVIANCVQAFENQDVQFEDLVDRLQLPREASRNPLFDISMVVQNFKGLSENAAAAITPLIDQNIPSLDFKNKTSKFDMTFFIHETEDDIHFYIEYYTGIFKEETVLRLISHFKHIIKAINAQPSIKLSDIDIMPPEEKRQVLHEFNNTIVQYPKDQTIHALFEEQVKTIPHRIALVYEDKSISFRELDQKANRLAQYLYFVLHIEKQMPPETLVGILLERSLEQIIALLAVLKAGCGYLPLDHSLPEARIKHMIDDAQLPMVLSSGRFIRLLNRLQWECESFNTFLCLDSSAVYLEEEAEKSGLMDENLWDYVADSAVDEITGGGWFNSYDGKPFSSLEMAEYGDNILKKLTPLLHEKMALLEIGCGSGISMSRIAPKVGVYHATDLSGGIIAYNRGKILRQGQNNIILTRLAAHEIDRLERRDFDLVIINSVIQSFHGLNYLRNVIVKAIDRLADKGYLFLGDILDQGLKDSIIKEMGQFKYNDPRGCSKTKTDWSADLFVARAFFEDLSLDIPQVAHIEFSDKIHTIENELTRFRYDALITIDKHNIRKPNPNKTKRKYQEDINAIMKFSTGKIAVDVQPGNSAYVIYTSGSTGKPKGVIVQHGNVIRLVKNANYLSHIGFSGRDRFMLTGAFAFDISTFEIWGMLLNGFSINMVDKNVLLDIGRLKKTVVKEQISVIHFTPELFQEIAMHHPGIFEGIRCLLVGGDVVSLSSVNRLRNEYHHLEILHMYGPTENTTFSTFFPIDKEYETHIPIGKPISNSTVYILDSNGKLQPIGVPGELCTGGDGVARGYLNHPELTAEKFGPQISLMSQINEIQSKEINKSFGKSRNPFSKGFLAAGGILYRTGDLARWLSDGNIEFLGRIDRQVKLRGYRIELGEIQNRLLEHRNVKNAVVISSETDNGEKYLCAYIVFLQKDAGMEEIKRYLSGCLPPYMVPTRFVELAVIPLTPSGKIDRKALPRYKDIPVDMSPGDSAPVTPVEKQVVDAWKEVLQLENIGVHHNFFEIGGNSISILKVQGKLKKTLGRDIPIVKLFKYPTIRGLARYLEEDAAGGNEDLALAGHILQGKELLKDRLSQGERYSRTDIAVIGMAGVFPRAANVREFWENLKNGVESITFFSDKELEASGVSPQLLRDPNFVKAGRPLEGFEYFDASFFSYTHREASIMDPQIRIFHQCAWHALEDAGYDPYSYARRIGLYAGASANLNWEILTMCSGMGLGSGADRFQAVQLRNRDFLCSRVSYRLNLKGPSCSIQTACSTSLVAVHFAVQGLLNGDCEMALAGGVSISYPPEKGYLYQPGMINSPDGHCRAFDVMANGTVGGNGAAVVVLKRLEDARRDHDYIHAVIKGAAINNDGFRKVSYSAPSVEGQAEVIRAAQAMAGVQPGSIGYIEAHGTGTELGDPVEVEALKLAFNTRQKHFCGIGSVKTNIGHLDSAAGVAGLIKTILALEHRLIPPSLHFHSPNPKLDLENSPFYVVSRLTPWQTKDNLPRRAGVSSLGIGGTNAHVIVEEAPIDPIDGKPRRENNKHRLILLSARTAAGLAQVTRDLVNHLENNPQIDFTNTAYTLQVGRRPFEYRKITVCPDIHTAVENLSPTPASTSTLPGKAPAAFCPAISHRKIIFLFPGQGSQYVNMGLGLYQTEPVFREAMDRCFEILGPLVGDDIKEILYPAAGGHGSAIIHQTWVAQPLIFSIQYALSQLLGQWGISPDAMMGHSIGEYIAAYLAGVFSLEDALKLVAARGRLMQKLPPGAMLAVPLSEEELVPLIKNFGDIAVAAVNNSRRCVVSGPNEAIAAFGAYLKEKGYETRRIHTSHAFHSPMMDPVLREFEEEVKRISLAKPKIPYISNLSGDWINERQVLDPAYWGLHMRRTVRFSQGLAVLHEEENAIFIEVGPGRTLCNLVNRHEARKEGHVAVTLLPHPQEDIPDHCFLLNGIGQLWLYGVNIHWPGLYTGEKISRISLPGYPFEKVGFRLDESLFKKAAALLTNLAAVPLEQVAQAWATHTLNAPDAPDAPNTPNEYIPPAQTGSSNSFHPENFQPPRDEYEKKIVRLWQEILGFDQVGIYHNFFNLNGDSLNATQLIARIKSTFNVDIPLKDFFAEPTVDQLAQKVKALLEEKQINPSPGEEKKTTGSDAIDLRLKADVSPGEQALIEEKLRTVHRLTDLLKMNTCGREYEVAANQALSLRHFHEGINTDIIFFSTDFFQPTDIDTICRTLVGVIERHSLLRTIIIERDGKHFAREYDSFANISLPFLDISSYTAACREKIIDEIITFLSKPMKVLDHLLFRPVLLKMAESHWKLVLLLNHLIFDGYSIGILDKELHTLMEAPPEKTTPVNGHYSYVHFMKEQNYDHVDLGKFLDIKAYSRSIETVWEKYKIAGQKVESFEVDISGIAEKFKAYYSEIALLAFAKLMGELFKLDNVPIGYITNGRFYKDGDFNHIIGDFHDIMPVLFSQDEIPPIMMERFIDYKRFTRENNLNFMNYIHKGYIDDLNIKQETLKSPFSFNALIGSYKFFKNLFLERRLPEQEFTSPRFDMLLQEDFSAGKLWITFIQNSGFTVKEVFMKNYFYLVDSLNCRPA